jgi:uncharacterized protein (TIGR02246 family)
VTSSRAEQTHDARVADDEEAIRVLYRQILGGWNARSGAAFAAPFAEDGEAVGFDGYQHAGRATIAADLDRIFAGHATPTYVGLVRGVRALAPGAAVLRAVAGMVPPGQADLDPRLNAVQTVVAARRDGEWRVALFQNTPAQFHGRPDLADALTAELRQVLARGEGNGG